MIKAKNIEVYAVKVTNRYLTVTEEVFQKGALVENKGGKMNKSTHRIDFSFLENMKEGTEHYEIMDIL